MAEPNEIADAMRARLEGRVETDLPLAPLTTYRLGGRARLFVEPAGRGDLDRLAALLRELDGDLPVLPLGRGSNLLFSDAGYDGIVIRMAAAFGRLEGSAEKVIAGAGVALPQLANWAARRGLAGAEFAIAIPGSIGGGVRMNAGAHGADVGTILRRVDLIDLVSGESGVVDAVDLDLTYRHSSLTDQKVVLQAELELVPDRAEDVKERVESYRRHRGETQPPAVQNAGSVFKNPPGDHAGRLVEAAGLKGFASGAAAVSELHANFFIARPGARAQDVYDLIGAVRKRVHEASGIWLEPEVRFVGRFEETETE